MVHWVYVLECEDDHIYVGETTRLFSRFSEHLRGSGGANTFRHVPLKLIGLYKVNDNNAFMTYRNSIKSGEYNRFLLESWGENDGDNLLIENHITERYLYERRENDCVGGGQEWYKVRGGKYTKEITDIHAPFSINPVASISVDTVVDRPLCKCHYLSEVKLSKDKSKVYFVCALKHVWEDFHQLLHVDKPCDFWEPYTEDKKMKDQYEVVKAMSKESWVTNIPLSLYKINPEPCISCNKSGYVAIFNGDVRRLCQFCIVTKYESLKETYAIRFNAQ
jgi:predicted GIY-YIG superfamily endonuclease